MKLPGARALTVLFLLAGFSSSPALATFHLMVVQEVFSGTAANPDAQYVMLRFTSNGQNLVNGHALTLQNAAGAVIGTFTFGANVPSAGAIGCTYPACPAIIIGTAQAATLLGLPMDLTMPSPVIPLAGGRVCFSGNVDCVAWGNFAPPNTAPGPSQNTCDLDFGTPAAALQLGRSLVRTTFNCTAKENSTQFALRFPRPVNNPNNPMVLTDGDSDQLIRVLDCNDADNASLYIPLEIPQLDIDTTSTLTWQEQAAQGGTSYKHQVVTGRLSDLMATHDFTAAACLNNTVVGLSLTDPQAPPAPDRGYYYLVRGKNNCGGSYGRGSSGTVPDPRTFLDSLTTGPCP